MGFIKEFKEFASRGNVVDLAVGIVLGAAFNGIVTSAVNDIIMPPIGYLMGDLDFKDYKLALSENVTINYGNFIQTVLNFIIVAFAVFILVKAMNRLRRKEAAAPATAPAPTREEVLLVEIRDAIREKKV
jgi:large conductance mechanosensitive channel